MASITDVQARSEQLFTRLLQSQAVGRRRRSTAASAAGRRARAPGSFSWFDIDDATASTLLSFRFSALSASKKGRAAALTAVLDDVENEITISRPELVRQALAMFVIHNEQGRYLTKPRTVTAAPQMFTPMPARRSGRKPITTGGLSPGLDYWREDPMANEHHGHWHEVYPYLGRAPENFATWVEQTPRATLVAILEELAPGQNWSQTIPGASVAQVANVFAQVFSPDNIQAIQGMLQRGQFPADLYWTMFSLNDRHGELFVYMHQQMLARYDAELLSNGLRRVVAFKPVEWSRPIPEGQTPTGFPPGWEDVFTQRGTNQTLPSAAVTILRQLQRGVDDALRTGQVALRGGPVVPLDRDVLGEFVEGELHNTGHGLISQLGGPGVTDPRGVMGSTISAIRDQVFWRWHKHVDDIAAKWQATVAPQAFTDAPNVVIRDALGGGTPTAWASPDIILVRTGDLPANRSATQLATLGRSLFGGTKWDTDFTAGPASTGTTQLTTVGELVTAMQTSTMTDGRVVRTLTHEPFSYFIRVQNTSTTRQDVTVRIFLAPAAQATDRLAWIEMDKFIASVPASSKTVLYRSDTESSVIKRPAELSPAAIVASTATGRERSYCDCGWPYPLLLPRGTTPQGMSYRLMVMFTDASIDRVTAAGHCGSMSFCGAVDRYPDTREMGYPFARPFAGPRATAIRDAVLGWQNGAARTVTIRHAS